MLSVGYTHTTTIMFTEWDRWEKQKTMLRWKDEPQTSHGRVAQKPHYLPFRTVQSGRGLGHLLMYTKSRN